MRVRFAVIGGDRRSVLLCTQLARDGHRVYTYALEQAELPAEIPKSGCLQGCVYGADCVVLPVPAEKASFVNAPFSVEPLERERLIDALWKGQLLCGGKLSEALRSSALAAGVHAVDIMARPAFSVGNAALTAEGALEIMLRQSERSIRASRVLILGRGRIGRILASMLHSLGAEVTVAARRAADRAESRVLGMEAVDFPELENGLGRYDFIVNTVPARVMTETMLCTVEDALLIELASPPGGFDRVLAENIGLRVTSAPGLPGKCAPYAAAELIRETVYDVIREQEGQD